MTDLTITAYDIVPGFAQGLVRDGRIRWAAREAGLAYDVQEISFAERHGPEYIARHPFGQVPAARVGQLDLFDSGAILYGIGLQCETLLPADEAGRLQVLSWMFATLNTLEPPMAALFAMDVIQHENPGKYRDSTLATINQRLGQLQAVLQDRDYLTGRFTIADIVTATALRFLRFTDIVASYPAVAAYLDRCQARPHFADALAEQQAGYDAAMARAA